MSGRFGIAPVAVLLGGLASVALAGCGDDSADRMALFALAEWNNHPRSVADVGYQFFADVSWVDRGSGCPGIPKGRRVTVNDIQATEIGAGGDCLFEAMFEAGPFTTPDAVTVRVFDGDHVLGQATFEGMFWGMQAALVSPAGGQVSPGDQVVVSIPPGKDSAGNTYAKWYWLDTAPGVPPFYTTSSATVSGDGATISATIPDQPGLAGRVALAFQYSPGDGATISSCTGFDFCNLEAEYTLGPISLQVTQP